MARKYPRQVSRQTFVQQDAHLDSRQETFAGFFQKANGVSARNGGVLFQEFVQRVAALDIIQQGANWNASASEAWLATHNLRVNQDKRTGLHRLNMARLGAADNVK
jgi:hypothetical protein